MGGGSRGPGGQFCPHRTLLGYASRLCKNQLIFAQSGSVTKEGTVRTDFTHQDTGPSPHAYNDPDLSAIEFLYAVMRAKHQPMAIRIEAARALLPFTNPSTNSVPRCTIVIGGLGPCDTARAQGPATEATENRSENLLSANTTLTHDQSTQAPQNLTTIPEPSPFIDYSTPPTPAEIEEIKAAVNRLRPDLAHLPTPEFHLCPCGHWITGTYPCCEALHPRDGSKLN